MGDRYFAQDAPPWRFEREGGLYNPYMRWLILSVSLAAKLSAQQVVTGTIAGTVLDPSGAAVIGAKVAVTMMPAPSPGASPGKPGQIPVAGNS